MRFLIRLSNKGKYIPADRKKLTTAAYEAVHSVGANVGNLRISSTAVELDLLLDSKASLEKALSALEKEIGPSLTIRELDIDTGSPVNNEEAIRLGLALFNEERYWESHEALEIAWRRLAGIEKDILQGIILIAAALVHLQKNEPEVARSILQRANAKLAEHNGVHFGVNIRKLEQQLASMISTGHPEFFKIENKR
jgi:tetratricopeptide (TPR) repeat protein